MHLLKRAINRVKQNRDLRELHGLLVGKSLTAHEIERQWNLVSDDEVYIHTYFWRLVGTNHIVVTSDDHGHQFGWPEPVDAAAKFDATLAGAPITGVEVNSVTGDLTIFFSNHLRLEIPTFSAGYETWTLGRKETFGPLFVGASGGIL